MIERPEGYKHETADCTVVALSLASNIPYQLVHEAFKQAGRKDRHKISARKTIQRVCKILNIEATQVKRSGSINKLVKLYPVGKLFCTKTGHAFAIIDGTVHGENIMGSHIRGAWMIKTPSLS